MKKFFIIGLICFVPIYGCKSVMTPKQAENEKIVLITTDFGNIKVKLYNETPKHRDNFITLVNQGFYEGLLFHRVIKNFMIQGGDPLSKEAKPGEFLGNGDPGYTIPAEILPKYFHKKGALAAARNGDDVNPKRESSGSQFYLVQGNVFTDDNLNKMESNIAEKTKYEVIMKFLDEKGNVEWKNRAEKFQKEKNINGMMGIMKELEEKLTAENKIKPFKFTEEQRKAYTTVGGTPHLDVAYTVFGEVTEGFDVVDKIVAVQTDANNRPLKDVKMKMKVLK